MTRYLITFPSSAMDHISPEDMPEVGRAAHACCQELINAGVYVLAGGLADQPSSVVAPDGSVNAGPNPNAVSGITIVDVPSREEALKWAGKIAAAHKRSGRSRTTPNSRRRSATLLREP